MNKSQERVDLRSRYVKEDFGVKINYPYECGKNRMKGWIYREGDMICIDIEGVGGKLIHTMKGKTPGELELEYNNWSRRVIRMNEIYKGVKTEFRERLSFFPDRYGNWFGESREPAIIKWKIMGSERFIDWAIWMGHDGTLRTEEDWGTIPRRVKDVIDEYEI